MLICKKGRVRVNKISRACHCLNIKHSVLISVTEAIRDGCKSHDAGKGTMVSKKEHYFSAQKRKNSTHPTANARSEATCLQRAGQVPR